jgi:hypothetical protein
MLPQGAQHLLALRALWVPVPAIQVRRVKRAHVDRQTCAIEAHGNEDAAISAFARLAAYPARLHRNGRPDHQHGGGRLELRGDLAVELLSWIDRRVPPYRPALRLDCCDQRCDARLVAAGVGNKDIGHDR